nr:AAA family ATPase [uncultured Acetatifactor sp.]
MCRLSEKTANENGKSTGSVENTTNRCKIIAISNQKGGVGKTTTCVNLGIGLARAGEKVLLVEADAQGSLAVSLGISEPDKLDVTLVNILEKVINDEETWPGEGIIRHEEGIDFIPANVELAGLETALVNIMSRETVMRQFLKEMRQRYDYILIDCMPSLGMITINALVAADYVLVPVEAAYLPVKGLQQLIKTIGNIHRKLNPSLEILGILLTKVDRRTNFARETSARIREVYGERVHIFGNCIPLSVRAAETAAEGRSIYRHDPKGAVAEGYLSLTEEVLVLAGCVDKPVEVDGTEASGLQKGGR